MNIEREKFEAWFMRNIPEDILGNALLSLRQSEREDRSYKHPIMQAFWEGWQARAALPQPVAQPVEHPAQYQYAQPGSPLFDGAEAYQQHLEATTERVLQLPAWFDAFLTNVCEIPDRNSPEDEPEAIVATLEELESCALNAIENTEPSTGICFFCGEPINGKHESDCPQAIAQPVEQTRALTDEQRAKMIADLEAEQTFISSSRERCDPNYELPRWDRLQAIIDHLAGGA